MMRPDVNKEGDMGDRHFIEEGAATAVDAARRYVARMAEDP
jgi:hypothetical protein